LLVTEGMTTPRAAPPVLTIPPDAAAGATAPVAELAMRAGAAVASHTHAWDDQEIDTAGTEADPWFPRSDGSV
jgi:hypothetical protein